MSDYIDRQAAIDALCKAGCGSGYCGVSCDDVKAIEQLQSAEVEPVKHGEWLITKAYPHRAYCSKCYKTYAQTSWVVWEDGSLPRKYCPNCGARMFVEGEEA